jgi:hypothetical protein
MIKLLRDFGPGIIFLNVCVVITVAILMLLRDFGPYGIIFLNVCVVITVDILMLLRDFGPYGIIFMNVCCYNRCHGNAVKRFGALRDIHEYMCSLLYIFPSILTSNTGVSNKRRRS